jgi:hypothetical protein
LDEVNKETGDQYINVSVSLQPFDLEMLDRFKDMRRVTRSQLIREALQLYYLKVINSTEPDAGVYVDSSGSVVHVGLVVDAMRPRIASGEWRLVKKF